MILDSFNLSEEQVQTKAKRLREDIETAEMEFNKVRNELAGCLNSISEADTKLADMYLPAKETFISVDNWFDTEWGKVYIGVCYDGIVYISTTHSPWIVNGQSCKVEAYIDKNTMSINTVNSFGLVLEGDVKQIIVNRFLAITSEVCDSPLYLTLYYATVYIRRQNAIDDIVYAARDIDALSREIDSNRMLLANMYNMGRLK